jgi:hypothetical protein
MKNEMIFEKIFENDSNNNVFHHEYIEIDLNDFASHNSSLTVSW